MQEFTVEVGGEREQGRIQRVGRRLKHAEENRRDVENRRVKERKDEVLDRWRGERYEKCTC